MEQLAEATAAGSAAVVSTLTLYPVNKVKTRLQAHRRAAAKQVADDDAVANNANATFLSLLRALNSGAHALVVRRSAGCVLASPASCTLGASG